MEQFVIPYGRLFRSIYNNYFFCKGIRYVANSYNEGQRLAGMRRFMGGEKVSEEIARIKGALYLVDCAMLGCLFYYAKQKRNERLQTERMRRNVALTRGDIEQQKGDLKELKGNVKELRARDATVTYNLRVEIVDASKEVIPPVEGVAVGVAGSAMDPPVEGVAVGVAGSAMDPPVEGVAVGVAGSAMDPSVEGVAVGVAGSAMDPSGEEKKCGDEKI